jgi:hypothetical protein
VNTRILKHRRKKPANAQPETPVPVAVQPVERKVELPAWGSTCVQPIRRIIE